PFPTYRDNQKSGRLVHISDLAEWIDKKREVAKKRNLSSSVIINMR
ncbi:pyocin activator PrtN family protein, partial [Shigella sp. FC1967]